MERCLQVVHRLLSYFLVLLHIQERPECYCQSWQYYRRYYKRWYIFIKYVLFLISTAILNDIDQVLYIHLCLIATYDIIRVVLLVKVRKYVKNELFCWIIFLVCITYSNNRLPLLAISKISMGVFAGFNVHLSLRINYGLASSYLHNP